MNNLEAKAKEIEAIIEEVIKQYDMKYSELSLTMRTLLAAVYVRGHKDAMKSVPGILTDVKNENIKG